LGVLIVGSIALDSVETPFGKVENALGGAATYASTAASLFTDVQLVGVVGEDFPQEHLDFLRGRGVDLKGVQVAEGKTFRWSGYYDFDLNTAHTRDTQLNVFERFDPQLPEECRDAEYVFLANINPELQLRVLDQVRQPKLVLCDTMNLWINLSKDKVLEVLSRVDVALMNDGEARQLFETPSLIRAGRRLLQAGPKVGIIKKGEHGALLFADGDFFSAPSYPLEEVLDPTGAGDSFAGGLIGFVAYTNDPSVDNLRKAIVYGSIVASFNVEDFSLNALRRITPEDIARRYEEFVEMTQFA
jgi:ribokinase